MDVARWHDADKVLLVSALTLPFALGWVTRTYEIQANPSLSTYANRAFFPTLLPFLWIQAGGHLLLVLAALFARRRREARSPWLVHAEVQFWFVCMCVSLYVVGPFTTPFAVLALALPIVGYHLFDRRAMNLGMVTMTLGAAAAILLPVLGLAPYAPFLAHAPWENGRLHPAWIASQGIPAIFAVAFLLWVHLGLVRQLHERHAELERLGSTDALTGLANRTVFFRRLEEEIARARRHGHALSVIMLDVDHFKTINDERGHLIGDAVLRQLGSRIRGTLRIDDLAARYGGEEFALLLPHTKLADAEIVATRLLEVVRSAGFGPEESPLAVTASLGCAELGPSEGADPLIARADAALYASKHEGRDRLTLATDDAAR
ncbi:MAG: GGDEF domain-containing protein [Polyangiales bacterium]